MRIGIIGTGAMGKTHAKALQSTPMTLVGFVSRSGHTPLAAEFGGRVFATLEEMLPHVDVVDICTPTHLHLAQAEQAARAGKHIICEKPLARTHDDAARIIQVCKDAGVQLLVAHVLRYFPDYADAQAAIAAGQIGPLREMTLRRAVGIPKDASTNWFNDMGISGGVLLDLLIHDFDFARWVAGEVSRIDIEKITPDLRETELVLHHVGGVKTRVLGTWNLAPGGFETSTWIEGERGVIAFDNAKPPVGDPNAPYAVQLQDFYAALTQGRAPRVTAQDALAALDISLQALRQTGLAGA